MRFSDSEENPATGLALDKTISSCPICSRASEFLFDAPDRHYGNVGTWKVYRCRACRHVFQNPVPLEQDLSRYYPSSYYAHQELPTDLKPRGIFRIGTRCKMHYLKQWRGYCHLPCVINPILSLVGFFLCHERPFQFGYPPFEPKGAFLDYGAGSGDDVARASFLGWNAEGIEINAKAAEAGRKAGLRIHEGSIEVLEQCRERYNYIMSSHCVEHVSDVRRLLHGFFDALKPGGVLVIDVPNGGGAAIKRFGKFAFYLGMPVHVHLFSAESLTALAREVGFSQISLGTYSSWHTHVKSSLASWKSRKSQNHQSFSSPRGLEWLITLPSALPSYWHSMVRLRGDCLVIQCIKDSL